MNVIAIPGAGTKNLFDNIMDDGNIGNDGQDSGNNTLYYRSRHYVPVIPGEKYQFSFNTTFTNGQFYIIEYDQNKGFISRTGYNGFVRAGGIPAGYTPSANTAYIRFFIYNDPAPHDSITWVQLEKNPTVTPYEPYIPYKFYGDVKLPSRYQPAIASDTTKFPTVLNGWATKVLDGVANSLKFNSVSPLSTFYFSNVTHAGITPSTAILCSHCETKNAVQNNVCYAGNNGITFHHSYSTVENANAWLTSEYAAGHPVTVLYPLTTPDGSVWNFVKDTKNNVFGYLNKETGEFCKAYGATGTLSTTAYDHYMLKGGAN